MSIDNIDIILPFLKFESEDDFYYLQILQRKKENLQLGSNSRVIKNYYIGSQEYLITHYPEIKQLCHQFNARASIRLNKRSFESVAFKTLENIANSMRNREYKFIKASYDRACGLGHNDKSKKWIIDVDKDDLIWEKEIVSSIYSCAPTGNKVLSIVPSKSGIHLITNPFNTEFFKILLKKELSNYQMEGRDIEIHKDNPTNLYIP